MIPTRRAALAQSGYRFSVATNASVCAEIMRQKKRRMIGDAVIDGGVPRSKKA
ncbi:hypothetical protein ACVIYL_002595 [Bradyrhizobium sp. USDA 3315]